MSTGIRRLIVVGLLLGGFAALCWATFTTAAWIIWLIWGLYATFAIGAVVNGWRLHRHGRRAERLSVPGQDPVQSIYSGRTPPTYYVPSADATSQIAGPPHADPLRLDGPGAPLPDEPAPHEE
ncbi:hypothetical protein [Microbacterium sp. KR10-403]|uniref:hypothetical protein n=1 Tax=Microbacterium sp. KR10-403 TaxID=3158581 RepID=UPI0032E3C0A0